MTATVPPEILYRVFEEVVLGPTLFDSESAVAVLNAALVCKQWSPIALDVLWRTKKVPSNALWNVLLWSEASHYTAFDPLHMASNMPPLSDLLLAQPGNRWSRLYDYGKRIRHVTVTDSMAPTLFVVVKSFLEKIGETALCPNLRVLSMQLDHVSVQTCTLLNPGSIRTLDFFAWNQPSKEVALDALQRFSKSYSNIEHFSLNTFQSHLVLSMARAFPGLRYLRYVGPIFLSTFETLSSHWPNIEELTLDSAYSRVDLDDADIDNAPALAVTFPLLTRLELSGFIDPDTVTTLSLYTRFPKLRQLKTSFGRLAENECVLIADHFHANSPLLESLEAPCFPSPFEGYNFLAHFRRLRELILRYIRAQGPVMNVEICEIVQGLPGLRVLEVHAEGDGASLETLWMIASSCTELELLHIGVETMGYPDVHCPLQYCGPVFSKLKSIHLRPILLSPPSFWGVAHLIRATAPGVTAASATVVYTEISEEAKAQRGEEKDEWARLVEEMGPRTTFERVLTGRLQQTISVDK